MGRSMVARSLPLMLMGYVTESSARYAGFDSGYTASTTVVGCPNRCQSSSASRRRKGSDQYDHQQDSALVGVQRRRSLVAIMKALAQVLKEKRSRSSWTFLIHWCRTLNSCFPVLHPKRSSGRFHRKTDPRSRRRNSETPSIPLVSQGFACIRGPRNISYKRKTVGPVLLHHIVGLMTLKYRFDIFPTSETVTK